MQILQQGENLWKLRIESEDDLWVLARLASKGRRLAMLGERRDSTTAESGSRASGEQGQMQMQRERQGQAQGQKKG